MTSESGKGGEGRGLPVGVEWHYVEGTGGALLRLIKDPDDILAAARADGTWDAWGAGVSRRIRANVHAQRRPDETLLAAAQREAEAALWARDGFGVGEVRGRFVAIAFEEAEHFVLFSAPVSLPGLPGLWRLTAAREHDGARVEVDAVKVPLYRCAGSACPGLPYRASEHAHPVACVGEEGGVEVDAVRAPVPARCPACGAILPATGIGCESCGWMGEPLPGDDERAPVEPATCEPSVPTDDDELARLLPGLAEDIERTRVVLGRDGDACWHRTARACELLLAERAVLARSFGDALKREDRAFGLRVAFEQGRATERARIAELEAALAAEKEAHQACHAERVRYHDTAARLEAERLAASATPPPHTVAALLARVEAEAVPDRSTWRDYTRGLNKAADIIRATLTPSPLDGVVAEVCALPAEMPTFYASVDSVEDGLHAVDMLIGDHELPRRDRLARIARVALAGMLACDAAKGGDK